MEFAPLQFASAIQPHSAFEKARAVKNNAPNKTPTGLLARACPCESGFTAALPPGSRVPEIGTPGLMSGDGKRGVGHRPQATAPILDSTPEPDLRRGRVSPMLSQRSDRIEWQGQSSSGDRCFCRRTRSVRTLVQQGLPPKRLASPRVIR